jgi:hypothetical protein
LEFSQVLKVGICNKEASEGRQFFLYKNGKQGRTIILALTFAVLADKEEPILTSYIFSVTLEPA